jgi:protein arginine kinase activator
MDMLCDDCKKNEACIHITQIGPSGRIDKNLCESCAAKYGDSLFHPQKASQEKTISMDDFLKGIFSNVQAEKQSEDQSEQQEELVCPNCGMSYHDFLQTGKIGCSVCYDTFRSQLEPLLRRIHGSSTHTGKIPHRSGGALTIKHEIAVYKEKLQSALKKEEYEKAAVYRDKIRALGQKLSSPVDKEAQV